MIDLGNLIQRVAARTGAPDLDSARRALEATVGMLGSQLAGPEVAVLAADLPPELAGTVRGPRSGGAAADPFAELAAQEGVPPAHAVEYAHVICQLLADEVDADTRVLLNRRLPTPWRELFHPRSTTTSPPAPPHHTPQPGAGHTLASGQPGSHHPIADHGIERAQSGSVAADDNPHSGGKLSSATAPADEVATARPEAGRRISDADG